MSSALIVPEDRWSRKEERQFSDVIKYGLAVQRQGKVEKVAVRSSKMPGYVEKAIKKWMEEDWDQDSRYYGDEVERVGAYEVHGILLVPPPESDVEEEPPIEGDSPLLALPPELRNRIYRLVLCHPDPRHRFVIKGKQARPSMPGLIHCSQQLRQETLSIYLKENCFTFYLGRHDQSMLHKWCALSRAHARASIKVDLESDFRWPQVLSWVYDYCNGRAHWDDAWLCDRWGGFDGGKFKKALFSSFEMVEHLKAQGLSAGRIDYAVTIMAKHTGEYDPDSDWD